MDVVENVYTISREWPKEGQYGLTNQVRRAAVSIPANIAEGQGRNSGRDFLRFLAIANGSLHEVETHLLVAQRLTYLTQGNVDSLLRQTAETGRLLHGLMNN